MAQKKITDLQLRSSFDATCNIPVDDASQTWRVTGAQVLDFVNSKIQPGTSDKVANYTLTYDDNLVTMDASAGTKTFTLPTAIGNSGKRFTLKKLDTSGNGVVIATTLAQTIDGYASGVIIMATPKDSITVVSNGANWIISEFNFVVAAYTTGSTTSFGAGGATLVPTTVTKDTLGALAAGVYTVKISGFYNMGAFINSGTSLTYIQLWLKITGVSAQIAGSPIFGSALVNLCCGASDLRYLAVGDTIEFQAFASASATANNRCTTFINLIKS